MDSDKKCSLAFSVFVAVKVFDVIINTANKSFKLLIIITYNSFRLKVHFMRGYFEG